MVEAVRLVQKIVEARAQGKEYSAITLEQLLEQRAKNVFDKAAAAKAAADRLGIPPEAR